MVVTPRLTAMYPHLAYRRKASNIVDGSDYKASRFLSKGSTEGCAHVTHSNRGSASVWTYSTDRILVDSMDHIFVDSMGYISVANKG